MKEIRVKRFVELVTYLVASPFVGSLIEIKGAYDYNVAVWARTDTEFYEFWKTFEENYKQHILTTRISKIYKMINFRRKYIHDGQDDSYEVIGGENKEKFLDEVDYAILLSLASDARKKIVTIAEEVGVNEKLVRDRIKKMRRDNIILNYRAFFNIQQLGYYYYKVNIRLSHYSKQLQAQFFEIAYTHPNIVYWTEAIGGWDVELEVQTKSPSDFYAILKQLEKTCGTSIEQYDFMEYVKEYKLNYLPVRSN